MQKRQMLFLIVLLVLFVGGFLGYISLIPRVISYSPANQAGEVLPDSSIEVTFSRAIQFSTEVDYLSINPPIAGNYFMEGNTLIFEPAVAMVIDNQYTIRINPVVKSTLGIPLFQLPQWTFQIKHPWLVYLLNSGTKTEIYQIDPAGLKTDKLIETDQSVTDYTIVSDGHEIIYTAETGQDTTINWFDIIAQKTTQIYTCLKQVCSQPKLSMDGKYLSFARGANPQDMNPDASHVMLATLNGKSLVGEPISVSGNNHSTRDPNWSSSGWLAFYDDSENVYGFYLPSNGIRKTFQHDTGELGSWSPDGIFFYFPKIFLPADSTRALTDYSSQIIGYSPETGEQTFLTRNDTTEDIQPVFSPDGKWVAFGRRYLTEEKWTPGRQLWFIRSDSNNPRALTNNSNYTHYEFSWSPDSKKIAFLRFNTADYNQSREVYMMDVKTGIAQKILVDGYQLGWLP